MNYLVLGMNYHPELTGIGNYTTALCEHLACNGTQVTMVTAFPHYPYWRIYDGYKKKYFQQERINRVKLLRTYVYIPAQHRTFKRLLYDLSLTVTSVFSGLLAADYDLVLCVSPPLTLGLSAYLLSRLKGVPFVFHIQDLVPDAALEVGMLKPGWAVNFAHQIERFIYRKASGISVISHGIAENLYAKGVAKAKVHYLPNWIDRDIIKPMEKHNGFRIENHLAEDDFLVMYAGNIGNKQGLDILVEAAALSRDHPKIKFFIVGEGSCKAELVKKAAAMNLPNLSFLSLQPRDMLPKMLSAADTLVITQQAGVKDFCFPGKLLTYMASATPLVAAVNQQSETAKNIEKAKAGIIVSPESAQNLKEAILQLYGSVALRKKMGDNGRAYIAHHFDKSKILIEFEKLLASLASKSVRIKI